MKVEVRSDGLAILTIDDPAGPHNAITPAFGGELVAALDLVAASVQVRAVVVRSAKPASFLVGANIDFVRSLRFALDAEEAAREIVRRFDRLGTLGNAPRRRWRSPKPKPVVALVHGPALGGGFELTLACTATVATNDPKTVFGLPEVKLGLVPAGNGLLRIAERAGLRVALELGLSGRTLGAEQARELGLVDEVVSVARGLDAAMALARRLADESKLDVALRKRRRRSRGTRRITRLLLEKNPVGRLALFRYARRTTLERTRGNYPAPERIIDIVEKFASRGFASAAALAPRIFGELVVDETARRLMELFVARTSLKKETGLEASERSTPFEVERVGVVGAGLMGAGISAVSAQAGCRVRVKETDDAAVERGIRYARELLDARRDRGLISDQARDASKARIHGTTDSSTFRDADVVFEAVLEELERKRTVVGDLGKVVSETCVVASVSSSIPIAQIATAFPRPEMVLGMHYTSPVHEAPLVEVVRTTQTDPRAIATAVLLGKRQGKTVIVVRDGTAFYTTRIRVPWLNEAVHLLAEGVPIDVIDAAMLDWGWRFGPFELLDEVGLDVCVRAAERAHVEFGARMSLPPALAALHEDGRKGKKNARGFYLHGTAAPRRRTVDATVYRVLDIQPTTRNPSGEEIAHRCSLALINEAFRCQGNVLRSARDGDVGAIFGVGFPPFRGGPFRYADVVGLPEVLRLVRSLEQRFGQRFEPAPLLVEMARSGRRFYG